MAPYEAGNMAEVVMGDRSAGHMAGAERGGGSCRMHPMSRRERTPGIDAPGEMTGTDAAMGKAATAKMEAASTESNPADTPKTAKVHSPEMHSATAKMHSATAKVHSPTAATEMASAASVAAASRLRVGRDREGQY
jgi:hypothetical protein